MTDVPNASTLGDLLEKMTGRCATRESSALHQADTLLATEGVGFSQLNEVLLLLGYDRVSPSFFQYLADGSVSYTVGTCLASPAAMERGVDRFRQHAMLRFGNIRFAFHHFSELSESELGDLIDGFAPDDDEHFKRRHKSVYPIQPIAAEDTFYLGYLIESQLKERLKDPQDKGAKAEWTKRGPIVERGRRNHEAYLASDHMDVYVATSMRERHEYLFVNAIANRVFSNDRLKPLRLRWFDPTQAYCADRLDKGLAEALMLRRARCTLYLAQESDTLGKDSELASTLAQGKPVIAFVPKVDAEDPDRQLRWMLGKARSLYAGRSEDDLMLEQLHVFAPQSAWEDQTVRAWLDSRDSVDSEALRSMLLKAIEVRYDSRAATLKRIHPLGIQVNLETGVANGVLVARTTEECAELILRVMTNSLEFSVEERSVSGMDCLLLKETVSGSVFRVVSGDALLTDAFWSFYFG